MNFDSERTRLLVLGLGNLLCADDGAGVRAVAALAREYRLPEGVRVLDGGTLGLQLLGELASAEAVILVDAVRAEAPAGTVIALAGDEVAPAVRHRLSVHQVGVADLLDSLELIGRAPRSLLLVGVVPKSLELSVDCSIEVELALPELVERVVDEARDLGFDLARLDTIPGAPLAAVRAAPTPVPSDEPHSRLGPDARCALGL